MYRKKAVPRTCQVYINRTRTGIGKDISASLEFTEWIFVLKHKRPIFHQIITARKGYKKVTILANLKSSVD